MDPRPDLYVCVCVCVSVSVCVCSPSWPHTRTPETANNTLTTYVVVFVLTNQSPSTSPVTQLTTRLLRRALLVSLCVLSPGDTTANNNIDLHSQTPTPEQEGNMLNTIYHHTA